MAELVDYEVQILKECAGLLPLSAWGAAVGAALEVLRGWGYVNSAGEPTLEGLTYLEVSGR